MDLKLKKNLEQARVYAYSTRYVEAYHILRRYYDRLPFQPEKEHAENISLFVRILMELGKDSELNFYLAALEKLHEKSKDIAVSFQLGVIYLCQKEPKYEAAKKLFEDIIRNPDAKAFHARSKMSLANYYDRVHGDVAACRRLIDSIDDLEDPELQALLEVWRAVVLVYEKRFSEAETILLRVLNLPENEGNWYAHFSAKVPLVYVYAQQGREADASRLLDEIRASVEGKNFKLVRNQLEGLEKMLSGDQELGKLVLVIDGVRQKGKLTYEAKSLSLNAKTPSDNLMVQLAKRGYLDKAFIVKSLYSRSYDAKRDDKLIYYHVHSLRKRLIQLGLPKEAITTEAGGYRLVPEVETLEEDL